MGWHPCQRVATTKTAAESIDREDPLPIDVFAPIKREVVAVVREKIALLGAGGRVDVS